MAFQVKHDTDHPEWKELYTLSNGKIEIEIPALIGPRITALRYKNGDNIFYQAPNPHEKFHAKEWIPFGGHRLWHAPEQNPRSYYPDSLPIQFEISDNDFTMIQKIEETTMVRKEIRITLDADQDRVSVSHKMTNCGLWPIKFSGWAITMMAPGGTAVIPLPERIPFPQELVPNLSINIWPYTDLEDDRIAFHTKFISIQQDATANLPLKIGCSCPDGWVGYFINDTIFIKQISHISSKQYPDRGSNVEVFTNSELLEVETLGPLIEVQPQEALIHEEEWFLRKTEKNESAESTLLDLYINHME